MRHFSWWRPFSRWKERKIHNVTRLLGGRFAKIMAALDDKVMDAKHAKQNIVSSMWHGAFQKEC
jgi:hypothetical protein